MFKKLLSFLLISFVIVFTSCQSNQQNQLDQQRKTVYMEIIKLIDAGEVEGLGSYIAENAIDHQLDPSMTNKKGLEGIKEMLANYSMVIPDMKTTVHSVAITGDTLFAHITSSGTPKESFMGMPANQKMKMNSVDIIRFEGNKMVEHWGFMDMEDLMKMMPPSSMPDESMMKK